MNGTALCLDIGNSQIYGGVFEANGAIRLRFRRVSSAGATADEYGVFLRTVLRENGVDPTAVQDVALCSVVPDSVYSLRRACQKYFSTDPFILKAGVRTGLQIAYRNPQEVGPDRIANAVAASRRYPDRNVIVVDFGTATTFDVVGASRKYLGGAIAPGLRISMEVLEQKTARLPAVEILKPEAACGRSTAESIQSGLYFGHLGMLREILHRITNECFAASRPIVLGTGGFAHLFAEADVFDEVLPDLVLEGIYLTMVMNEPKRTSESQE